MKHEAIRKAHPNVSTIYINDTETIALDKDNNIVSLDETKVAEEIKRLQEDYDSKQYQRDRKYPNFGEQFDLLFKDINKGTLDKTGVFYTAIKAVKDAHPKPSE